MLSFCKKKNCIKELNESTIHTSRNQMKAIIFRVGKHKTFTSRHCEFQYLFNCTFNKIQSKNIPGSFSEFSSETAYSSTKLQYRFSFIWRQQRQDLQKRTGSISICLALKAKVLSGTHLLLQIKMMSAKKKKNILSFQATSGQSILMSQFLKIK